MECHSLWICQDVTAGAVLTRSSISFSPCRRINGLMEGPRGWPEKNCYPVETFSREIGRTADQWRASAGGAGPPLIRRPDRASRHSSPPGNTIFMSHRETICRTSSPAGTERWRSGGPPFTNGGPQWCGSAQTVYRSD